MTTLRSLLNETGLPKNEARMVLAHLLEIHLQLPKSALLTHDEIQLSDAFLRSGNCSSNAAWMASQLPT
jgi:release factor glutamine methyltransferase